MSYLSGIYPIFKIIKLLNWYKLKFLVNTNNVKCDWLFYFIINWLNWYKIYNEDPRPHIVDRFTLICHGNYKINWCRPSGIVYYIALSHPLAWAHLATSIADWLPLLGRHSVQQEALVPHFFWQSSRAERHLGSFWQVAHWVGHFYSMHFWGSASVIVEISMANESKAIDNIRTGIFIVDFISI